jgi:hypothetical protein
VVRCDFALGAPPPLLSVAPTSFALQVEVGSSPANQVFTVSAAPGGGPVSYVVREVSPCPWLAVTPSFGDSRGEADTITIDLDTATLATGDDEAWLEVSDPAAANSPVLVQVDLAVTAPNKPADFDGDGDVDQNDFGHFQQCLSGPSVPQGRTECQVCRFDQDSDVDQDDFLAFMACISGSGVPSDPECLNN